MNHLKTTGKILLYNEQFVNLVQETIVYCVNNKKCRLTEQGNKNTE